MKIAWVEKGGDKTLAREHFDVEKKAEIKKLQQLFIY